MSCQELMNHFTVIRSSWSFTVLRDYVATMHGLPTFLHDDKRSQSNSNSIGISLFTDNGICLTLLGPLINPQHLFSYSLLASI